MSLTIDPWRGDRHAVAAVYVWDNSMVMVFDSSGQQMPEYQGPLAEVGEKIAAVFPRERWIHGRWNGTRQIS